MLSSEPASAEEVAELGLEFNIYRGADPAAERQPLAVLVHGRAGNRSVMGVFSKALERIKPLTVYPQAFLPDQIGGFSWWPVEGDKPAPMEQLIAAVDKLELFIDRAIDRFVADPGRIYSFGFSQGSALISMLSLRRPELFCGVAILGGFIPKKTFTTEGMVAPEVAAKAARLPEYFIFHGTTDQIIPFSRAEETAEQLRSFGADVTFAHDDVGHKVSSSGIRALTEWIERLEQKAGR